MKTLLEGAEAIAQPCTLALLIPGGAAVLAAGKNRLWAIVAFILAATLVAWARFADRWFDTPSGAIALAVGAVVLAAVVVLYRSSDPLHIGPAALAVGAATGWLWEPCVGPHLGSIINEAPDGGIGVAFRTLLYVTGSALVAIALAVAPLAIPTLNRWVKQTRIAGAAFGLVIALLIMVGLYDDLVTELVVRSRG